MRWCPRSDRNAPCRSATPGQAAWPAQSGSCWRMECSRPRCLSPDRPAARLMSAFHGANQPVLVTFFSNFAAATKQEETICLRDLADRIVNTSAASKGELPWLKLATFGDLRTAANSLRHNANVLVITGIEADYDGERVGFEDAVAILTEAGGASVVYTSPSHTEGAPRWRVLCPFSKPTP